MRSGESMRVGFVGLGLIGGSLALALRDSGFASTVVAWDASAEVLGEARSLGVIDTAAGDLASLMEQIDLAVLAAPTRACEVLLGEMLHNPGSARCITDVASVKGALCAVADAAPAQAAARFVPGHPIAGSERSGVAAARADLFVGYRVILTPGERTDPEALALTEALWSSAGALPQTMGVNEHDAVLAATSHLPHMLAYALVDGLAQSSLREDIFRFAAGGFRDFTRIASSDPVMWRDIALANRGALLDSIDAFSRHLQALRALIDSSDTAALEHTFRAAKSARDQFARDLAERGRPDAPPLESDQGE
jgi:prephenate dehydrogenase